MNMKFFSLLFAVAASVGTMFAEKVQIGDLYYNLDATNQTAEVTSQNSRFPYWSTTITTANTPASVTYNSVTYSVTSIGDDAFDGCKSLTSVTIPNSVTSIGKFAFNGCTGLTSVTIPNSVTSIGNNAFYRCIGLTSVTIPNSVTSIGESAFNGCSSLTSVAIPNNVTSIGDGAFSGCKSLTSVTISNSVTSIGYSAFSGCTGLTSVAIPNNVTSIGDGAFSGCTGLTSINVASDNSNYCSVDGVLFNKDKTTLIQYPGGKQGAYTIPNSVTSIGHYAFFGCSGLISLTIPNSVTSIGWWAFSYCSGLTSVTIPNSVTSIGSYAFQDCTGLTSIKTMCFIPPTLGEDVFSQVDPNLQFYLPQGSETLYQQDKQWRQFTSIIPFRSPFKINGLYYTLNADNSKAEVTYENLSDTNYTSLNIVIIPPSVTLRDLSFDVTSISDSAFTNCASLEAISLPSSLTSIGDYAFANINSRKFNSIIFPHRVVSVGKGAFSNDIYLENIEFGDDMEFIGEDAFKGCSRVLTMTSWSEFTPNVATGALDDIKSAAELYVRSSCLRKYEIDDNWNRFLLKEIGATETTMDVNEVTVVPADNTALFAWPTNENAATYTITITKGGEVFCILVFNANGQLTGIAFAPGRNGARQAHAAIVSNGGMQFTVTGLDIATRYDFTLKTQDETANVLAEYTGSFGTTGAVEGLYDLQSDQVQSTKILHDGQIVILRGEKIYNAQGALVK